MALFCSLALKVTKDQSKSTDLNIVRNILGADVSVFSKSAALTHVCQLILESVHTKILFLNAHSANLAWQDDTYRRIMEDFLIFPDGLGIDLCSFINYGQKFPNNLNGTDFIPHLLDQLDKGVTVALLGARPGVAERAAECLQKQFPSHKCTVLGHGYFAPDKEKEILDNLSALKPDILLVAFGNPAQEKWIARKCHGDNCTVVFGVGALFDFIAGRVPRAPAYVRCIRMEWLYRLWREPKRMWARYIIGNPVFIVRSLRQKLGMQQLKSKNQ